MAEFNIFETMYPVVEELNADLEEKLKMLLIENYETLYKEYNRLKKEYDELKKECDELKNRLLEAEEKLDVYGVSR